MYAIKWHTHTLKTIMQRPILSLNFPVDIIFKSLTLEVVYGDGMAYDGIRAVLYCSIPLGRLPIETTYLGTMVGTKT